MIEPEFSLTVKGVQILQEAEGRMVKSYACPLLFKGQVSVFYILHSLQMNDTWSSFK